VAAHDGAATWMMIIFYRVAFIAIVDVHRGVSAFFLFTLPAGALADKVDRQKLVCTVNVCLAATTFALAVLGWMHLLNPCLILGCVFFIGVWFAINSGLDIDRTPNRLRRGAAFCGDPERFAIQLLGHYRSSVRRLVGAAGRSQFCLCS
jgi:hypothetical protein